MDINHLQGFSRLKRCYQGLNLVSLCLAFYISCLACHNISIFSLGHVLLLEAQECALIREGVLIREGALVSEKKQ